MINTRETEQAPRGRTKLRVGLWLPGLLVALGAAVATAHGLYEVAVAAQVPTSIAWLYPLITDGLALVAYAATSRLAGSGRGYAWFVVVLAAGLSGLAQASYLAQGVSDGAPTPLRFGVGAWPAIAAAIVAHLLYLIATDTGEHADTGTEAAEAGSRADDSADISHTVSASDVEADASVQRPIVQGSSVQPDGVQPGEPVQLESVRLESVQPPDVQPAGVQSTAPVFNGHPPEPVGTNAPVAVQSQRVRSSARDRANSAAMSYRNQHGELPTVTQLMEMAETSRGTAGEALKTLRNHSTQDQTKADS